MIPLQSFVCRTPFAIAAIALVVASTSGASPLFQAPFRSFSLLAPGTNSVALGDLNGDGAPDLVVGSQGTSSIAVQLNTGNGEFGPPSLLQSLEYTRTFLLADVNGDGFLDLAVTPFYGSKISVFLGYGDGEWPLGGGRTDYAVAGQPFWIAVGDVNRDGRADLVVATSGGITTLLGDDFGTMVDSPTGGSSVALADFNRDGRLDLVAGYQGGATSVFL